MAETRWLDRVALAHYIAARVDELPRMQKRRLLPQPSLHLGPRSPRWDRTAVDTMFAGRAASATSAIDAAIEAAVNEPTRRR